MRLVATIAALWAASITLVAIAAHRAATRPLTMTDLECARIDREIDAAKARHASRLPSRKGLL